MKKRHLIFLGNAGIIYYSWLLVVGFLIVVFCLEGNTFVNPPTVITGIIFVILLFYTWAKSYVLIGEESMLKLPYRKELQLVEVPTLVKSWKGFYFYKAKLNQYQSLDYLVFYRKRDR